ncbi:hypothetical protein [Robertmurraya siralis]|uniref:hypothetical protein n=1 Tax=Robertmurraya siralis TaxID=77777 RepID=UPI001BB3AFE8|nr:hypothetical protein [Robertmurraya siralis]
MSQKSRYQRSCLFEKNGQEINKKCLRFPQLEQKKCLLPGDCCYNQKACFAEYFSDSTENLKESLSSLFLPTGLRRIFGFGFGIKRKINNFIATHATFFYKLTSLDFKAIFLNLDLS